MDALSMLKFWKISIAKVAGAASSDGDGADTASFDDCPVVVEPVEDETDSEAEYEEDEEDDSFFEMEFTLPDYGDSKFVSASSEPKTNQPQDEQKFTRIGDLVSSRSRSPLPSDMSKSRDKTRQKPQSPISILKSAPKLRVSMFGKLKKSSASANEADKRPTAVKSSPMNSQQQPKSSSNNLFIKFRIEDTSTAAKKFARTGSSKPVTFPNSNYTTTTHNSIIKSDDLVDVSSKRFSKDSVQKYLNLIKKPMYVKVAAAAISKRSSAKGTEQQCNLAATASCKPYASPSSSKMSPAPPIASPRRSEEKLSNRLRAPLKNLGKSRSGNALIGSPSTAANRKDDSLVQQNDGIQGAILHCKQSLKSSVLQEKRSSLLSRCSSDPSCEKSLVKKTTTQ